MRARDGGVEECVPVEHVALGDRLRVRPGETAPVTGLWKIRSSAGNGVNDAPALAVADVSIAMWPGTDVAIKSVGVTLLKGDLVGIDKARFHVLCPCAVDLAGRGLDKVR